MSHPAPELLAVLGIDPPCKECDGEGGWWVGDDSGRRQMCYRCNGTGREPKDDVASA